MNIKIEHLLLFFLVFNVIPYSLVAQCTVGPPQILNGATATLCGNAIEVETTIGDGFVKPTFKWRAVTSVIGGVVFGSDDLQKTTVTGIAAGDINIYVEVTETDPGGTCGTIESAHLSLNIGNSVPTPTIFPGNATVCSGQELDLTGNAIGNATYKWSVEPAVSGAFNKPNSPATAFTAPSVSKSTTYKIYYKVSIGDCVDSSRIFVRVNPALSATIENGTSVDVCLAGEIGLTGLSSGGSKKYTHKWEKIGGTGTEGISTLLSGKQDTNNPIFKTPATAAVGTTYMLRYTLADDLECAPATADILITLTEGAAPVAMDQTNTQCSDAESEFTLNVAAGSIPAAFWDLTEVEIPAELSARKWNSPIPASGLSADGLIEEAYTNTTLSTLTTNYTVIPISSIGCRGTPITVTMNVHPQPIAIEVAKDLIICSNAATDILLKTDAAGVNAANWEIWRVAVPNGIQSGSNNALSGMIAADAIEQDEFLNTTDKPLTVEYTVQPFSSEGCNGNIISVTVDISNKALPDNVSAGADQLDNCATITILDGSIHANGTWSIKEGQSNASFFEPNNPKTTFSGLPGNTYEMEWTVSSSECAGFARDQVSINFASTASLSNVTLDVNDASIETGIYQAGLKVNSAGTIDVGADVTFRALSEINLNAGFHAKAGSNFIAKIEGCTPLPTLIPEILDIPIRPLGKVIEPIAMNVSPNPFSGQSFIHINLPKEEVVSIGLFNQTGQLIKLLVDQEELPVGKHSILLTADQIPLGLFYVRMITGEAQLVKKVILLN